MPEGAAFDIGAWVAAHDPVSDELLANLTNSERARASFAAIVADRGDHPSLLRRLVLGATGAVPLGCALALGRRRRSAPRTLRES